MKIKRTIRNICKNLPIPIQCWIFEKRYEAASWWRILIKRFQKCNKPPIIVINSVVSNERWIFLVTGLRLSEALAQYYDVHFILARKVTEKLIRTIKKISPVLVIPDREDGIFQNAFEEHRIPFWGSSSMTSAKCFDKMEAKTFAESLGIQTAKAEYIRENWDPSLELPFVIKPLRSGSSFGLTLCYTNDQIRNGCAYALKFDSKIYAESFIKGTDYTILLSGTDQPKMRALISAELSNFSSYKKKYHHRSNARHRIERFTSSEIELIDASLLLYKKIGCRDLSTMDWIIDEHGRPFLLEINTLPNIQPGSIIGSAFGTEGITYAQGIIELVEKCIAESKRRV